MCEVKDVMYTSWVEDAEEMRGEVAGAAERRERRDLSASDVVFICT